MSVRAIELSKGDIAQGVNYPKDGLEALHGPMLCKVHILHHCSRINELSGCPLHEILNSFLVWPSGEDVSVRWIGLLDLLEFRPQKSPYVGVGHI